MFVFLLFFFFLLSSPNDLHVEGHFGVAVDCHGCCLWSEFPGRECVPACLRIAHASGCHTGDGKTSVPEAGRQRAMHLACPLLSPLPSLAAICGGGSSRNINRWAGALGLLGQETHLHKCSPCFLQVFWGLWVGKSPFLGPEGSKDL